MACQGLPPPAPLLLLFIGGLFVPADLDPYHPGQLDALVALADALREQGDDAGAAAALGRLQASMVAPPPLPLSSDLAEMAAAGTLPVPPTEAELLQKAAVLKACGRADLLADLALSALTATLRAYRAPSVAPTDDFALTRNKTRLGGRGRRASRGGGSTREDAVFVGYQADRRRRVKPAPQPSGQAAPAPVEELPGGLKTFFFMQKRSRGGAFGV